MAKGYNSIDLIFVLAMAVVSLSLAAPSLYEGIRDYGLVSAAEELADTLERAKTLAASQDATYQLHFNTAENSFRLVKLVGADETIEAEARLGSRILLRSIPANPITFTSQSVVQSGSVWLSTRNGNTIQVEVGYSGSIVVRPMRVYPFKTGPTAAQLEN